MLLSELFVWTKTVALPRKLVNMKFHESYFPPLYRATLRRIFRYLSFFVSTIWQKNWSWKFILSNLAQRLSLKSTGYLELGAWGFFFEFYE